MCCYWMTTNIVSLCQALFLRIPVVRTKLNIPPLVPHDKAAVLIKKKGFMEGMKESKCGEPGGVVD